MVTSDFESNTSLTRVTAVITFATDQSLFKSTVNFLSILNLALSPKNMERQAVTLLINLRNMVSFGFFKVHLD